MRKIYYRDAVREALDEEMARDPMVMMIGEDIGVGDGTWRCSKGLYEKYGDLRMKDSPISEITVLLIQSASPALLAWASAWPLRA